jgi:hypothetical protein
MLMCNIPIRYQTNLFCITNIHYDHELSFEPEMMT